MRFSVWLGLVIGCSSTTATPPGSTLDPWTSGSISQALQWSSDDGFTTFAGTVAPAIDFACRFDIASRSFVNCPVMLTPIGYADSGCTTAVFRPSAQSPFASSTPLTQEPGHYYLLASTLSPASYDLVDGVCTLITAAYGLEASLEVSASDVDLTSTAQHDLGRVDYTTLETADGFSIITAVAGSTMVTDDGPTRLRNMYEQRGGVRALAGIYDTAYDEPCQIDPFTMECVPVSFGDQVMSDLFSPDTNCTTDSAFYSESPGWTIGDYSGIWKVLDCHTPAEPTVYQHVPSTHCAAAHPPWKCLDPTMSMAQLYL